MFAISNVEFSYFYSDEVSKDIVERFLIGNECNNVGTLKLKLKQGRVFEQSGPHLLPPIRWIESFELFAEFEIICKCSYFDDVITGSLISIVNTDDMVSEERVKQFVNRDNINKIISTESISV